MALRDNFSFATKRKLAERAGFQCSFPDCGALTIGASEEAADASVSVGEAAHIAAAAPGGPRFDSQVTPESRASIENGIWMCRTHAALIDRDTTTYTTELLREWKMQAEKRSRNNVGRQPGTESTRQAGSKLTTSQPASLSCSIRNCKTEDVQNCVSSPRPLETWNSVSIILPTDYASGRANDSYFWRHLGHYRHELTIATFKCSRMPEITIGEFLSEIYHRFLAGVVEPYSYGHSWILAGLGWGAIEILAPWELLNVRKRESGFSRESLRDTYKNWSRSPLAQAAILERGYWVIRDPQSISTFGVATTTKDRAWFMRHAHPEAWKALLSGHRDIPGDPHPHRDLPSFVEFPVDLKGKSMISIDAAEQPFCQYEYHILFEDSWWGREGNNEGRAFVVSDEFERSSTSCR